LKNLVDIVRSQKLFAPGETVVVAVSGGADSVCLLDVLTRLDGENLRLVVAHLNHGLRGEDSDEDERFVARLAGRYGLPFASRRVDVAALAAQEGLSLEDAGRRARYRFLTETAKAQGAAGIAVAHHRDDQAETVLIRLLRGAGGSGLSAMSALSTGAAGLLKRPLLPVCRAEIERYLTQRGLGYRNDDSNADTAILRNRIRHELIPQLRTYNPKITERLAATAEILAGDEALLQRLTDAAYLRLAGSEHNAQLLSLEPLLREPRALRLRLYRRAVSLCKGDLERIALPHLEAIDRLARAERPNARLNLPDGLLVKRRYSELLFRNREPAPAGRWQLEVPGEGDYPLPAGGRLRVALVPRPDALDARSRSIAYLSPVTAPFPWLVRNFARGDRFRPLGMSGEQKVKELFINRKVPAGLRCRLPLVVSGGRILWVAGVMMAEDARVKDVEARVVQVEILDITP